MKFKLGQVVATPGCLQVLKEAGQTPSDFLGRHANGDWGDLDDADKQENDLALESGGRIFSAYHTTTNTKIWVITEAIGPDGQRASTCLLLPDEY
ncbi:hypothetical protein Pan258_45730 [Symmachiella dynata]|uniref:hypothetical protein n=1 Tax=Symmachiella dynata TaxID=2527995 RepID=UPI001187C998|nr:hypothetical protein [Symmachiella dynata]QDT50495.1 hypothetical protein Pan258_45730 [Symmachiella dynata]